MQTSAKEDTGINDMFGKIAKKINDNKGEKVSKSYS